MHALSLNHMLIRSRTFFAFPLTFHIHRCIFCCCRNQPVSLIGQSRDLTFVIPSLLLSPSLQVFLLLSSYPSGLFQIVWRATHACTPETAFNRLTVTSTLKFKLRLDQDVCHFRLVKESLSLFTLHPDAMTNSENQSKHTSGFIIILEWISCPMLVYV